MTDQLNHTDYDSPVGRLRIVTSDTGIVAILWPDDDRYSFDTAETPSTLAAETISQLDEFFAGERTEFDLPLDLRGTEFQVEVWRSLTSIPFGETTSYGAQAIRVGRPTAVRAVAAANGRNPVSIVVPCHRVVGAGGKLTGFAGGLDTKRWLLDHESSSLRLDV